MRTIIGIDLGTTNSCAAVSMGNTQSVLLTAEGDRLLPSAVYFPREGPVRVGHAALQRRILEPENTIVGIKRLMGRQFNEVVDFAGRAPFKVVPGPGNLAMVEIHRRLYTPQEISAYILRELKRCAEAKLGKTVIDAVIAVPAYFGERQRQATREAVTIAGLNAVRIIPEPTAAAMAFGARREDEFVAVFDLGGGTFDVTVLDIDQGVFEVKSIAGDGFLGGDDFDQCLVDWISDEILLDYGLSLADSPITLEQVREAAIRAKCDLSVQADTAIKIPYLFLGKQSTAALNLPLSRQYFNEICEELFERLVSACRRAQTDDFGSSPKVRKILLVGAATRMPGIDRVVERVFGVKPSRMVNPDEAVALGAAVQAGVLSGLDRQHLLLDVVPHTLGVEANGGNVVILIPNGTTIPTLKTHIFTTEVDNQASVEINILEGNSRNALGNRSLGRLVLGDIPPAKAGLPQIEVKIDVDANGACSVRARDIVTGNENQIRIVARTGMPTEEIESLKRKVSTGACC